MTRSLGNSKEVAEDHYLMVTPEDVLWAASMTSSIPTPPALVLAHQESSAEKETAVSPAFAKDTAVSVPPRGVEHSCISSLPVASCGTGDAKTDAVASNDGYWVQCYDTDLEQLVAVWDSLTRSVRKKILGLVAASTEA